MNKYIRVGKRGFTLIELMIVVAIVGILASLAIYGVKKYIANAKTAEARNSLGQIGKDQQTAYEKESIAPTVLTGGTATSVSRALCSSSKTPGVPTGGINSVKGLKYQANQAAGSDWLADSTTAIPTGYLGVGFTCLKFSMSAPQYYMYTYAATGYTTAFSAIAYGDLNGDGITSIFALNGAVDGTNYNLYVAPNIAETNPEE